MSNININRSIDTFEKSIPFKIYCLNKDNVSGTIEHSHDYMQIWYILNGSCYHTINNKANRIIKGNIFIIPPFVSHSVQTIPDEDIEILGCEFNTDFIIKNISVLENKNSLFDFAYIEPFIVSTENVHPRLLLSGAVQIKVESLLNSMLREYEQEDVYYEINIKADLLKLLAVIAREYDNHIKSDSSHLFERYRDSINSAIKYLDNNYINKIYIEDICKIALMSQTYFSFIFKQITGKTVIDYVNTLRIRDAKDMLSNSKKSITDICFCVGFNNASYFNKVFKKETGLSPRQYRNFIQSN